MRLRVGQTVFEWRFRWLSNTFNFFLWHSWRLTSVEQPKTKANKWSRGKADSHGIGQASSLVPLHMRTYAINKNNIKMTRTNVLKQSHVINYLTLCNHMFRILVSSSLVLIWSLCICAWLLVGQVDAKTTVPSAHQRDLETVMKENTTVCVLQTKIRFL
jgi:hypothetical protein